MSVRAAVRPALRSVRFAPLTPARWRDFERMFGPRGACAGCWCMWPRLSGPEFRRRRAAQNKRSMKGIVSGGEVPGLIAYVDGEAAGWCALAPRTRYARLENARVLAPVDDLPVWSVICFFVVRPYRRRGLVTRLLREAVRHARARGAKIVEGYPIDLPRGRSYADAFVWHGPASAFRAAGFVEVARRSPTRPIMRRMLGRAAAPTRAAKPHAKRVTATGAKPRGKRSPRPRRSR